VVVVLKHTVMVGSDFKFGQILLTLHALLSLKYLCLCWRFVSFSRAPRIAIPALRVASYYWRWRREFERSLCGCYNCLQSLAQISF